MRDGYLGVSRSPPTPWRPACGGAARWKTKRGRRQAWRKFSEPGAAGRVISDQA
jgi:hypothetical protein